MQIETERLILREMNEEDFATNAFDSSFLCKYIPASGWSDS